MKKSILVLFLTIIVALSLVACGDDDSVDNAIEELEDNLKPFYEKNLDNLDKLRQ